VVQFNFLHRFITSDKPFRKVSNFPTFTLASSVYRGTTFGFNYSTNSTLAPRYPNEWEFFLKARPVSQEGGFPLDIAGEVAYNVAAEGVDGELTLARRMGPVRLLGVVRALSDPFKSGGNPKLAAGGGATIRLTRHLAIAGDVVSLTDRNTAAGEKVAWSAGLHIAIPNTPHTLSLQATNTNTATLQGASRGGSQRRYGFEFTIPITLARYFGSKPKPPAQAAPVTAAPGQVLKASMKNLAFQPASIEIAAGTTIEWYNDDQLPHTVTADDNSFDSGPIDAGTRWRKTFDQPGTYTFHCTPHPFMKGIIVVK